MKSLTAALALAFALVAATAGTAPAAVLQCGDVVTRNVTLTADVTGCPDTGLVVGADDVRIDLNGHRIAHDASSADFTDTGIDAAGHRGLRIRDGEIAGFETGVELDGSDAFVSGLRSIGNRQGVDVRGEGNRVSRSTFVDAVNAVLGVGARDTVVSGVRTSFGDFRFLNGEGNEFYDNRITGGTFSSILLFDEADGRIVRTRAPWINVRESDGVLLAGNQVRGGEMGIDVAGSTGTRVFANRVSGVAGAAFDDSITQGSVYRGNVAQSSEVGFFVGFARHGLWEDNVAGASAGTSGAAGGNGRGIVLSGGSPDFPPGDLTFRGNRVHGNTGDGITLEGPATDVLVEDNAANYNGGDGIRVDVASAVLAGNAAYRNTGFGIVAGSGAADGGGNAAAHNGAGDCSPTLACS